MNIFERCFDLATMTPLPRRHHGTLFSNAGVATLLWTAQHSNVRNRDHRYESSHLWDGGRFTLNECLLQDGGNIHMLGAVIKIRFWVCPLLTTLCRTTGWILPFGAEAARKGAQMKIPFSPKIMMECWCLRCGASTVFSHRDETPLSNLYCWSTSRTILSNVRRVFVYKTVTGWL